MSYLYDTTVFYKCSQYECEILKVTEDFSELHIEAHRVQKGNEVTCPYCGGAVVGFRDLLKSAALTLHISEPSENVGQYRLLPTRTGRKRSCLLEVPAKCKV